MKFRFVVAIEIPPDAGRYSFDRLRESLRIAVFSWGCGLVAGTQLTVDVAPRSFLVCEKCGATWEASTDVYHTCELPKSLPVLMRPIAGLGFLGPLHLVSIGFVLCLLGMSLLIGVKP